MSSTRRQCATTHTKMTTFLNSFLLKKFSVNSQHIEKGLILHLKSYSTCARVTKSKQVSKLKLYVFSFFASTLVRFWAWSEGAGAGGVPSGAS